MSTKTRSKARDGTKIRGFFRVHIVDEDGMVAGDSGWQNNQITNLGFNQFLVSALGAIAGSKQVSFMALGEGGVPNATDTSLSSEVVGTGVSRAAVTAATSSSSKTVRFTATFSSTNSFVTQTENISNIGLFNSNAAGTLFAGNAYNSSSCATNQNVFLTAVAVWHSLLVTACKILRKFGEHLSEKMPSQAPFAMGKV